MRRLRSLSEAECYARCYGAGDTAVSPVRLDGRLDGRLRAVRLTGERVRRLFEDRLDARAAEAA